MKNTITVEQLSRIFELLIQKLRADNVEKIDVPMNEYWYIGSDEWANFKDDLTQLVGSLDDDWDSIKSVIDGQNIISYLDFERVGFILRAISETIIPTSKS